MRLHETDAQHLEFYMVAPYMPSTLCTFWPAMGGLPWRLKRQGRPPMCAWVEAANTSSNASSWEPGMAFGMAHRGYSHHHVVATPAASDVIFVISTIGPHLSAAHYANVIEANM